ncbi:MULTISPECIES: hypothetical protein [unclassified Clostridium]|uniref:hypothetical protein n=1 Tax=unclassified Clostridium TaxID=2614128 RepID=UPI0002975BBA|nr:MULTISPECIES: hypothetical protein [unclassified Clostridium]EKQ52748.1 MAG: hypothetical protein A370_04053 [Clostridium sp. Maddingley MBC34-26]
MSNYFRDFMQPTKTIFERLQQQKNQKVIINGNNGGSTNANVIPPFYPDLPEYPCELIRGDDNKVTEIHYGKNNSAKGYVWRHIIHRGADGKVDYIRQENPDGTFEIVLHRDSDNKVKLIDIE